jgi:trigger factor
MQTTLEDTERHTVRMTVEVPPDEYAKDLDRAYRKIAGQVRIPGFRQGKAPRQVIDAMVGREVVLEEFVHDTVPEYYAKAVNEHELIPIADPEIDIDDVDTAKPLRFTVTVEVRPKVELSPEDYEGLRIEAPATEPTDTEIDEYVDRLRERFAELDTVSRPARTGDHVLADVRAYVHDREVPEATRMGYLAEVGDENLIPELNKELEGARAGDILKFNAPVNRGGLDAAASEEAGASEPEEVSFQVLVKEVKTKRLPALDDEFATTASEFDTLAELRDDIRTKIREVKEVESAAAVRERALAALVANVNVDLPERLIDDETDHHLSTMQRRAERMGITMDALMQAQGIDELRLRADAREHATRDLVADLALEAVARNEKLEATPDEMDREIQALARAAKQDPKAVRRTLERSGRMIAVAGDIIRSKALDLIVERANIITDEPATSGDQPEAAADETTSETTNDATIEAAGDEGTESEQ